MCPCTAPDIRVQAEKITCDSNPGLFSAKMLSYWQGVLLAFNEKRVKDILTENIIHRKLYSMNVHQLQHIGQNTFIKNNF